MGVGKFSGSRGDGLCRKITFSSGGGGGGVQTPEDTMAPGLTDSYRSAPRFYRA